MASLVGQVPEMTKPRIETAHVTKEKSFAWSKRLDFQGSKGEVASGIQGIGFSFSFLFFFAYIGMFT